ncbi:MAG: AraC family transcriptional regulator [Desulfobacterales bacterium]|nr:AraC family transcriptional regulator [Desulfobacterales bacterium]
MTGISKLMDILAKKEGINNTNIPEVKIYKASEYQPRQPLCYEQGIIIVGQGRKRVFLGDKVYEYNPDNYLVLSVPIPAECETLVDDDPLLSVFININITVLNQIFGKMDLPIVNPKKTHRGLYVAKTTDSIKDAVKRLLQTLQSEEDSRIIGEGVVHEILYRIACSENAEPLYALALQNTNISRVDKALKEIHTNYQHSMDVEKLAGLVNMSTSAFHRAFKDVTSSSPIQYIKKIRLDKARNLLLVNGLRVNEAATEVGYESATQFSREFKRYFGSSPVQHIDKNRLVY